MARFRQSLANDCLYEFQKISENYGLTMTQLALGWCYSQARLMLEKVVGLHMVLNPKRCMSLNAYIHTCIHKISMYITCPFAPLFQNFVTSTIIGATSTTQLKENIEALNAPITASIRNDLNEVYIRYRDPTRQIAAV